MPKTLLVISKYLPEYTGAAFRIHSLYKRFEKANLIEEIQVLCNSTSETCNKNYYYEGIPVKRIVCPWRLFWLPQRGSEAFKVYYEALFSFLYILREKPDFLHVTGYSGATIAALIYGRLNNVPRLVELVTREATPFQYLPGLRYPKFLQLKKQTVIVAISKEIGERCKNLGLKANLWCRPNPVDETRFKPCTNLEKSEQRMKLSPFKEDDIVIGMVAKFMPQKNQIFLLEVLRQLPVNFKLLLAGPIVKNGLHKARDEAYFNDILTKIEASGLQKRVKIQVGFVNAANYIKACDIYVMPQYSEGLGTPMLEAIATCRPIIANEEEPEFSQWIKCGKNGYLSEMKPEIWVKNIDKARRIPKNKLRAASKNILTIASMVEIDLRYQKLFEALQESKSGQKLNIKDVF